MRIFTFAFKDTESLLFALQVEAFNFLEAKACNYTVHTHTHTQNFCTGLDVSHYQVLQVSPMPAKDRNHHPNSHRVWQRPAEDRESVGRVSLRTLSPRSKLGEGPVPRATASSGSGGAHCVWWIRSGLLLGLPPEQPPRPASL